MKTNEYGRSYERLCRHFYRLRWHDCKYAFQRVLRASARCLALRNWYPRVLHGLPLGASCSRRPLERSSIIFVPRLLALFGALTIGGMCALSAPNNTYAAIITSYSASQTQNNADINNAKYELGTGLTGTPTFFLFHASSTSSTTLGAATHLIACPNSGNLTGCYTYASGANTSFTSATDVTIVISATTTMNSSYYYYIDIGSIQSGGNYRIYGSTNDNLPGRVCNSLGSTPTTCTTTYNIKTGYFYLGSTPNFSTEGITSIISPTYGQVVSSANNVLFSYNYFINSLSYTTAGFSLTDNTIGQNIDTSSASSTINSSGSSTFNGYLDLITGHSYTWTPYLYSTITGQFLYGTSSVFFAGSQSNQSIPASPTPLWNGCSNILCPGAIFSTSTGILTWNGGTTTTPFGPFGETLDTLLAQKAPFSYLYDIKQVLFELGNGSTTNTYSRSCTSSDGYYQLPTGSMGTQLSNGSTSVKFIDACFVQNLPVVIEIRKAISYAIYLFTGIGMVNIAMSAL